MGSIRPRLYVILNYRYPIIPLTALFIFSFIIHSRHENRIGGVSKLKVEPPNFMQHFDKTCQTDIPRIIHQSYISLETLPEKWKTVPDEWKKTHPDFEYRFWSDESNRELIRTKYPWFLSVYDGYPNPISRADAARYFVIYTYGGIYSDMDITPLKSITAPLLCHVNGDGKEMIVMETPNLGVTNSFFAAKSNSTILNALIHDLPNHKRPLLGYFSPHLAVLFSAGTTRYWMTVSQYPQLTVSVPAKVWNKCSVCEPTCPQTDPIFRHLVGSSWHRSDGMIFNWSFCHAKFLIGLCACAFVMTTVWFILRSRNGRKVNLRDN